MPQHQQTIREATEGELFRLLIENVHDYAIFVMDSEGRVRSWNPGAERLLGYSESEIVGQPVARFFTPEDIQGGVPEGEMRKAVESGRGEDERWHVRKDGSRFWSAGTMTALWDEGHNLRGFAKIMRDRTAQKMAEQERREIETRFTSLVKNIKDHAIITMEPDGSIVTCNTEGERILGYSTSEILGQSFSLIFTPEDLQDGVPEQELRLARETGRAVDERWHVRNGGEKFWALGIVTPTHDASGRHTGFSKILRDMTEQKLADDELQRQHDEAETQVEERTAELRSANEKIRKETANLRRSENAVRSSEARKAAIVDVSLDAIIKIDHEGKVIEFNPAAERTFGYSRSDMVGKEMAELIVPPHLCAKYRQGLTHYLATGEGPILGKRLELSAMRADGSEFPIELVVARIPGAGQPMFTGFIRDVTERKQAERRLNAEHITAKALAESPKLEAAVPKILECICKSLTWAWAGLWIVNPQAKNLALVQFWDGSLTNGEKFHATCHGKTFKLGEGFPGRVWANGEPVWVPDVMQDENFYGKHAAARCGLNAAVAFPIMRGRGVCGVIEFFSQRIQQPDKELLEMMVAIGNQIGQFIERKHTEAALGYEQEFLKAVLENAQNGIVACDWHGILTFINRAAREMLGNPEQQLLGQKWSAEIAQFYHADGKTLLATEEFPLNRALNGEQVREVEIVVRPKGNVVHTLMATGQAIKDAGGKQLGAVGVWHDVTERKQAVEILRSSEDRYRRIVETTPDGIWTLDAEHRTNFVNRRMAEMLGYTVDEMMGQSLFEFMDDESQRTAATSLERRLWGEHEQLDFKFRRKDGSDLWSIVSTAPILEDGRYLGALAIITDISERNVLEQQLRQAQKMEAFGQLAGGVAHDFNNLLTIISGYSDILLASLRPDDRNRGMVQEIHNAGERAALLTRQLLAFSRKQVVQPQVLDLNGVVASTQLMLGRLIGEDVNLTTALAPGLRRVKVDPGQIEQVIMNLVVNARDAMPQGGSITIETANVELDESYAQTHADVRPGLYVLLAVCDTGSGMTEAVKRHIFEPFYTTKEVGKGTGLGLATVYGIVKQSGGHVGVYSEVGQGTTFKIYLPIVEEIVPSAPTHSEMVPPLHGTETILLTEDDLALRVLARHVLQMHGYKVLEASQGEKALRIAEEYEGTIHMLVTDVVMPSLSGRQIAERLAVIRPGVKVLYLSGYTDDAVVRHGVLQAETAFLQKPFTPGALAAKVREVLDQ